MQQYAEFRALGCDDVNKCAVAHRCVQQLRSGKIIHRNPVQCLYDAELRIPYVIVDSHAQPQPQIYVPLSASIDIDLLEMDRVQQRLTRLHSNHGFNLSLYDANGTMLNYRMSDRFEEKSSTPST